MDNPFFTPSDGEADWDSSLNANFFTLDRGYHFTERAGTVINTGAIVWLNASGFAFPFDPNSTAIFPTGMAYKAVASGDSATFVAWGIVRSLGINSPAVPGADLYVSALTPGLMSVTSFGPKIGRGLSFKGVLFQPDFSAQASAGASKLASLTDVDITGVANGKVLKWSDTNSKWVPGTIATGGSFGALTDVNTTGVTDGSIAQWSNASSSWVMVNGVAGINPITDVFSTTNANGPGFDPNFVSSVTLSNSNRIAHPLSNLNFNHMMGQPARYSGKRYFECIPGAVTGVFALGIAGTAGHRGYGDQVSGLIGQRIVGQIGWQFNGGIQYSAYDSAAVVFLTPNSTVLPVASVWLGVAVDLDNKKMWVRVNTQGQWTGLTSGATTNPSSNVGGIPINPAFNAAGNLLIWPALCGDNHDYALYLSSADIGSRIPINFVAWAS